MATRHRRKVLGWAAAAAIAALVAMGLWNTRGNLPVGMALTAHPKGIMGTQCTLTALVATNDARRAQRALSAAEGALRRVEGLMSTHLNDSEISRLNRAGAGEVAPMSAQTLEVLAAARAIAVQTGGAFDITCRPLIQLWKRAGKQDRLPTTEELRRTRAMSGWDDIQLLEGSAVKALASARIDPGGIAKGYAIDRAVEAMVAAGCTGGLVNVGGDLRCFGAPPGKHGYEIKVNSPFGEGIWATLRVRSGAVCTSGNYARFTTIGGVRYSHIVDPRTGRPADAVPSVTVIAPTAVVADAWATALSVLGPAGLKRLPPGDGIAAMLVVGTPRDYKIHLTGGFGRVLAPEFLARQKSRLSLAD